MFLPYIPPAVQRVFPDYTWRIVTPIPAVYLTFDDGPIPQVTPWVLHQLAQYGAKATFFCVGDNVVRHSDVYQEVLAAGHAIGNHTFHHVNGWRTHTVTYAHDVRQCARVVKSRLFRPPYGQMRPAQAAWLKRQFRIIMWDVLSGDYDARFSADQCFRHVQHHTRGGSIILMHDSLKAERNLRNLLPRVLDYCSAQGWSMLPLPS